MSICIITFFAYLSNKGDLFSPSVLVCLSFFVCSFFALINYTNWELDSFSGKTTLIIILGILIFVFSDYFVKFIKFEKKIISKKNTIFIKTWKNILIILFLVCVTILIFDQVKKIGSIGDSENLVYNYRINVSYKGGDTSSLINMLQKISVAIGFVYTYIFIATLRESSFKQKILYIIPILITVSQSLLSGSRFNIIKFICAALIYYSFYYIKKSFSKKFLIRVLGVFLFFLVFFYFIKDMSGRVSDESLVEYISLYVGGSIKLFDMYVKDPPTGFLIFGKETFYSINQFLTKLNILNVPYYPPHLEFRWLNGVNLGNVYTGFRRTIQDFGIPMGMLLTFVVSMIYSLFYRYTKMNFNDEKKMDYSLFYYGMIGYVLATYGIDDNFYLGIISASFVQNVILTFILTKILFTKVEGNRID